MLPLPSSGYTAAYTAKQGENAQGGATAERKILLFLCIAYQDLTCDKGCALRPSGQSARGPPKVGQGFCLQKVPGCQRQARRSAYPT